MILSDFSQFSIAAFFAVRKEYQDLEQNLGVLRHLILSTLGHMNHKFRKEYGSFVLCCDSGISWRKKTIFPLYKARRTIKKSSSGVDWKSFHENIEIIRQEIQENLNFRVISVPYAEADDIIACLCREYPEPTIILSADKDFIQLQSLPYVKQWDNKNDRWIRHDNPKRYLFDHIMRGDDGDDIPNVLSDIDTFVTEGKRQKQLRQTKLDEWWDSENIDLDAVDKQRIILNKKLIDLNCTPKSIQEKIKEQYEQEKTKENTAIYKYFAKKRLGKLLDRIGEFK